MPKLIVEIDYEIEPESSLDSHSHVGRGRSTRRCLLVSKVQVNRQDVEEMPKLDAINDHIRGWHVLDGDRQGLTLEMWAT